MPIPLFVLLLALAEPAVIGRAAQPQAAQRVDSIVQYRVLVAAESDDVVNLIEFTPCNAAKSKECGAHVVRSYVVGVHPVDIEGPHGIIAAPDGRSFYVTMAHGKPNGRALHYSLATGDLLGDSEVGMFAATVDLDRSGRLAYVINFNFNDPGMKTSSLSVVETASMLEVARIPTCRMPHGSRLAPDGRRHYSGCMMDDLLVEVDPRQSRVTRLFRATAGSEGSVDPGASGLTPAATDVSHGDHASSAANATCSPTWAQPSADGTSVFVACNRSAEILEVSVAKWAKLRRWKTPAAPYNMAVTPDGLYLVVTQKGPGTVTVWRLRDASLVAELPGSRKVASGVAISSDSRYAFVSLEGIGDEPGGVDVVDLGKLARVASVDVGRQAGGIALIPYRMP